MLAYPQRYDEFEVEQAGKIARRALLEYYDNIYLATYEKTHAQKK